MKTTTGEINKWKSKIEHDEITGYIYVKIYDKNREHISTLVANEDYYDNFEKIVSLIETSPELLEVAENILDTLICGVDDSLVDYETMENDLKRVIQKAKGELDD